MTRLHGFIAFVAPALLGGALSGLAESIPVEQHEPIILRVLNGKTGQPLIHLHLVLVAGYNELDIGHRLWREEAFTNAAGEARLPKSLVNLPFLEVSLAKAKLCQASSRGQLYNVGRIRNDGLNAPNRCGVVLAPEEPRVLTIFAKGSLDGSSDSPVSPPQGAGLAELQAGGPPKKTPDAVSYPPENELRALGEHSPAPAAGAAGEGTAEPVDSYDEMCLPKW
jgi:hypothetical protein